MTFRPTWQAFLDNPRAIDHIEREHAFETNALTWTFAPVGRCGGAKEVRGAKWVGGPRTGARAVNSAQELLAEFAQGQVLDPLALPPTAGS